MHSSVFSVGTGHVARRVSLNPVRPHAPTLGTWKIRTIPIWKRWGGRQEEPKNPDDDEEPKKEGTRAETTIVETNAQRDGAVAVAVSEETIRATDAATETQDIVADWEGGKDSAGPWFGGDSAFTVSLIVGLTVVSTLMFAQGVSKIKHTKATRGLRQRVRVDAPIVPRASTAELYPTGWQSFSESEEITGMEPSFASSTADYGSRTSEEYLPLRTPEGERSRTEYLERQREKVQDFQNRVDSIGVAGKDRFLEDREDERDEAFDMLLDDDYAKGSRMTFREMKERANKASQSAARAAAHAHAASVAATIASEACNEATSAAHRALEASMKTQRALERASGQHIQEIYEVTKKEEAIAERRARTAAENSARGLTENFNAGKASRKACEAADATRPRGLDVIRAWASDAKVAAIEGRNTMVAGAGFVRDCVVAGRDASSHVVSLAVSSGREVVGNLKERVRRSA